MSGYYKSNRSEIINSDGWLNTGDFVYYDEVYCFHIVGRVSNVFKYQDWVISPKLIEDVLLSHPVIKDAVVIPIPNEEDVNHPFALVVLKHTLTKLTPSKIVQYVDQRVHESHRLRGGVRIVEFIPVTKDGYRNRHEIYEIVVKNRCYGQVFIT